MSVASIKGEQMDTSDCFSVSPDIMYPKYAVVSSNSNLPEENVIQKPLNQNCIAFFSLAVDCKLSTEAIAN